MENAIRSNVAVDNGWIANQVEALRARYARYRMYRTTVTELSALSDRALADLGVSRPMIRSLARETAYGN